MRKSTAQKYTTMGYDLKFISEVMNDSTIIFHSDYFQMDGVVGTIISITDYPKNARGQGWFSNFLNTSNTITQIKVGTESRAKIKKKLEDNMNAQNSILNAKYQQEGAKHQAANDYVQNEQDLNALLASDETYKRVYVRILMFDTTLEKLKRRYMEFKEQLTGFRSRIFSSEMANHMQQFYIPASQVQNRSLLLPDKGFPMKAYALSGTYWFNQTFLQDPRGGYIGLTYQNGEVMFDPSYNDGNRRLTPYTVIVGGERSGKSSLAKKLSRQLFSRGDTLWVFDKSGEYKNLVDSMHGVHLTLDGSENNINLFEVFGTIIDDQTGEIDEKRSFYQHINKIKTYYKTVVPDASIAEINMLGSLLMDFYIEQRMWVKSPEDHPEVIKVIGLDRYPILDDFTNFLRSSTLLEGTEYNQEERIRMDSILTNFTLLKDQYGPMVNGETTIPDLLNESVIRFDTSGLSTMGDNIYAAQYFNILSLMNAYVSQNGRRQFKRLENHEFSPETVRTGKGPQPKYFWWLQDEADDIFNAQNTMGVQFGDKMMAQQAKNFFGIIAIFPRLKNLVPDGVQTDSEGTRAMNSFFSRFQNQIVVRLSPQDVEKLAKVTSDQDISDSQREHLSQLSQGEMLLSIVGNQAIFLNSVLSEEERNLFTGGL